MLFQKLFHWFSRKTNKNQSTLENIRTVKNLDYLDTVWVKDNDTIFEGWVFDITRRGIIIVYGPDSRDFRFIVEKQYNNSEITQGNKTLYCNRPNK